MEIFYLLNVISLISVFGFAGWLLIVVFKTTTPPTRRNSRSRNRSSVDSTGSEQLYLDTNLEITSSYYYDEDDDDDSGEEYQSVASSRRVSFADKLHDILNTTTEKRRLSCIDLKQENVTGLNRRSSTSTLHNLLNDGVRKRNKFTRSDSDPGESCVSNVVEQAYNGPPKIAVTSVDGNSRRVTNDFELSFNEENSEEKQNNGGVKEDEVSPQIIEEYLSQHSTGMPRRTSDQRRGSFLYRSDAESSSRGLSRASSMSSMNENRNSLDDIIVTPFAQILAKLRDVRHLMHTLTNLPEEGEDKLRLSGSEQQQMLLDGLFDVDWVLEHLNKIKARNSVGELAQTKFKRMLTRELSQFSETSKSGIQVAEWVSNTYFTKDEDEMDMEKQRSRIPMIYAKRIISQAQQALKGNVPKYGIEVDDTEGMQELVSQLHIWNFDIFTFNTLTKDHPLVALSYTILQDRGLMRIFNIDACTFIKYMFVIEGHYHKTNPYHNATHGADVMQSCHVLLGCPVIEQVFTDLEVFAVLISAAIHDVDHPGLNNQFLSTTGNSLAILYNDHAILENHHLATAFKYLQEDELNIFDGMPDKQRMLMRKMIIDLVLATDMSKHLGLMADIKTTVESSKVAHNGKLILESYNERMLVLQGIIHSCDLSSATKSLPLYTTWTERIIEEFYQQGDRERELKIPISPMYDRYNPSIEKSQVGFIDFIVLPLWETLGELMYPYCQDMLTQLNDNRNYYFCKIPESPRGSISEGLNAEDRSSLQMTVSEKRKSRCKGHSEDDKLSDLSSIDEGEENHNISDDGDENHNISVNSEESLK